MDPVYQVAVALGRLALRALDVRVGWTGVEHVPRTGPALLAVNHVSYPDFVFVEKAAISRGRHVRFMTRHDVWNVRPVGWAMDRMGHVPVDRQAPAHAYLRARRLLAQGHAVAAFPEAGISYSYTVRPLMRGVASLAQVTGAPLVPVAIWGSQRLYTVGDPEPPPDWRRGRRIDLAFGQPVHVDRGDDPTELTRWLGHRLTDMLEELQQRPEHRPRPGEVATWYPAHLGGRAPTRRQARLLDEVPAGAVIPTWGPDPDAYG